MSAGSPRPITRPIKLPINPPITLPINSLIAPQSPSTDHRMLELTPPPPAPGAPEGSLRVAAAGGREVCFSLTRPVFSIYHTPLSLYITFIVVAKARGGARLHL